MESNQVEQVRRFNRLVTQRIGALEDSYLSRGRPLSEARLIFEVGRAGGIELKALRGKLGLDSGYLSRLLRSLEAQGLVETGRSPEDGRIRQLKLTDRGEAEYAAYDALSDRLAADLLAPLSASRRERLLAAMAEVERLLGEGGIEFALEPPDGTDGRWCLAQYFAELDARFDNGFDQALGNSLSDAEMAPPAGYLIVARSQGEPVGCGVLKRLDAGTGEVKRVWVAPSMRGRGVASRLMDELEAQARKAGFDTVKLDTNKALTEAHALYQARGYRETGRYNDNPYAHHWFEKGL